MSYPFAELEKITAQLAAWGFHPLTPSQLLAIDTLVPLATFTAMARAASEGDDVAVAKLVHATALAMAHSVLAEKQIKIPMAYLSEKRKLNPPGFKDLFTKLSIGSPEALDKVTQWAEASGSPPPPQQRFATPVQNQAEAPVHPTHVEPPTEFASQDNGYRPEPPARHYEQHEQRQASPYVDEERRPAAQQPSNVTQFPQRNEERTYDNVTVYGLKTALQFDHSPTRDRTSTTINISLGKAKGDKCLGGVNWAEKIMIMLTPKEVALIASVMLGQLQTVRFAGHGSNNEKWIEVAESTDPLYQGSIKVTMAMGKDIRNCSITFNDIIDVISIFNRALLSQHPGSAPITVGQMTLRASNLYLKALAAKEAKSGAQNR